MRSRWTEEAARALLDTRTAPPPLGWSQQEFQAEIWQWLTGWTRLAGRRFHWYA